MSVAQCAQRRASFGMSEIHSGHFLVAGSIVFSGFFVYAVSLFRGVTTKK